MGQPIWQLLGGLCRTRSEFTTPAPSADYNRVARGGANTTTVSHGASAKRNYSIYEDLEAQMGAPEALAQSLLDEVSGA